ncbi:MAG: hypothetical protein ACOCPZ_00810 [Natrialbaceae archaeon]
MGRSLERVVLGAGALLGLCQTYGLAFRLNRGPEGRWWERVRRLVAGTAARVDVRAGPRPITPGEYAGVFRGSLAETEAVLYSAGFFRNPTARLKTRDGEPEDGSWVYRESPLAPRQLHLMLFERSDGHTDIYAHEELSSVNPLCAMAHFTGSGQSVAAGVFRARELFDLDTAGAPQEPPEGAWNARTN